MNVRSDFFGYDEKMEHSQVPQTQIDAEQQPADNTKIIRQSQGERQGEHQTAERIVQMQDVVEEHR